MNKYVKLIASTLGTFGVTWAGAMQVPSTAESAVYIGIVAAGTLLLGSIHESPIPRKKWKESQPRKEGE